MDDEDAEFDAALNKFFEEARALLLAALRFFKS